MKHALKLPATIAMMIVAGVAPALAGPLEDGEAALKAKDYATALKLLTPLANKGEPTAQLDLGEMYRLGHGVPEDAHAASAWTNKAAEQGSAEAQLLIVAQCLLPGLMGAATDCARASTWLRDAADRGDPQAEVMLGSLYLLGRADIPKDPKLALSWFRKAAEQGNVRAEDLLASFDASGAFGVADGAQALFWYRKAAEQGDASAYDALGMAYSVGMYGLPQDDSLAFSWYSKAAEKGDMMGEMSVADMYADGKGAPTDPVRAVFWYRKLAEQGISDDQAKVGTAFALGRGAPHDDEQAYVWLSLAISNAAPSRRSGDLDVTAIARDSIAARLTPTQIQQANGEIAVWRKKFGGE
jgi:TPR repeat protein